MNDAFSAAHRAHASTEGVARHLPSYAGRLMQRELEALTLLALENPERPVMAIVGGAKISTKLDLLGNMIGRVQVLVIGGAMANTLPGRTRRRGGEARCRKPTCTRRRATSWRGRRGLGCEIVLPVDAVVATEFKARARRRAWCRSARCPPTRMILDAGPETVRALIARLPGTLRTVVWNGPLGAFEIPPFDAATVALAQAVAAATEAGTLRSVAGGGDTVSALRHAGVVDRFSYVSSAGGAFLEWLEGKLLPGILALTALDGVILPS